MQLDTSNIQHKTLRLSIDVAFDFDKCHFFLSWSWNNSMQIINLFLTKISLGSVCLLDWFTFDKHVIQSYDNDTEWITCTWVQKIYFTYLFDQRLLHFSFTCSPRNTFYFLLLYWSHPAINMKNIYLNLFVLFSSTFSNY